MGTVNGMGRTDVGRQRVNNEDAFLVAPELRLAVVADGMGGEACGEVASAITVRTLEEAVAAAAGLMAAVRAANQRVVEESRMRPQCAGMGSTVVAARWEGARLEIVSVGDSRAYLYRGGALTQLTYDQNLGNELRDSMGWTAEQVSRFPQRNVLTAAIGAGEEVMPRETAVELRDGDWVLLCSDGLYGPVGDAGMALMLGASGGLEEAARNLIMAANEAGGPDNITVVLLEYRD